MLSHADVHMNAKARQPDAHWDPGPFCDIARMQHEAGLGTLGTPGQVGPLGSITVAPNFASNQLTLTGTDTDTKGKALGPRGVRLVTPKPGVTASAFPAPYPGNKAFEKAGKKVPTNDALPYVLEHGQKYVAVAEMTGVYRLAPDFDGTNSAWITDDTAWVQVQLNHRIAFIRREQLDRA